MKTTNLTIQEAIQSGLPFKRAIWTQFVTNLNLKVCVENEDIMATDYLLEQKEVTITREKLAEAWDVPYKDEIFYHHSSTSEKFNQLCKNLGL